MYTRDGILIGKQVTLRAIFTDGTGELVAPDDLPNVYIYDTSVSTDTINTEAEEETWTSALGPFASTEIAPGLYEYTYTVPTGWEAGTAHDVWDAEFSGIRDYSILSFVVETQITGLGAQLRKNEVLTLVLDSTIASLDGEKILGGDITLAWTTQLDPFCVSVELVQMTLGPAIEWIPPATLAMMIYWSSMEAAHLTPPRICNLEWYRYAKAQFVIYSIALKAYYMPGGNGVAASGAKRLGDLSITRGGQASGQVLSSGIDAETIKEIKRQRAEWFRVVNSGACLLYGQSLPAGFAIPGWNVPGRVVAGRLFDDPSAYPYAVPTANMKHFRPGHARPTNFYSDQQSQHSPYSAYNISSLRRV
jgi:hypothetical protein